MKKLMKKIEEKWFGTIEVYILPYPKNRIETVKLFFLYMTFAFRVKVFMGHYFELISRIHMVMLLIYFLKASKT